MDRTTDAMTSARLSRECFPLSWACTTSILCAMHSRRVFRDARCHWVCAGVGLALMSTLGACNFDGEPDCVALVSYNDGEPQTQAVTGGEYECSWTTGDSTQLRWGSDLVVSFRQPLVPTGGNLVDVDFYALGTYVSNDEAEPCVLTISNYEVEAWTKHDRHRIVGTVVCGGELSGITDLYDPISELSLEFGMYTWDDADYYGGGDDGSL